MKILVVGNGGREHALLWKLARDAPDADFFATRPNGGMAGIATAVDLDPADVDGLVAWAAEQNVDLTVVGPEAPLAAGIADRFAERGLAVFGPCAGAARIESSKAFAKKLMVDAGVPTADYAVFRDAGAAAEHIRAGGDGPVVVKASGLAAGKGAIVCDGAEEAVEAARAMLEEGTLGAAGSEVVVEEFMRGEELSLFALCDGETALPLLPSQDHKRIGEGDTGPNTGGMGAYAPVSLATAELTDQVVESILHPTLHALAAEGSPFRGLLYAGLMLTDDGPKVVEFNCRFGDPESQVVLPLMESSLFELMRAVASGESLRGASVRWSPNAAVTTVLAAEGYPGPYAKGMELVVPDELRATSAAAHPKILLFHAGTRVDAGALKTSGGRVMAVTGIGSTLGEASARSLRGAAAIEFSGKVYRSDIGWREFARDEWSRP
ncbi:MAG: phosphoribosylamine--glycine ligase [Gemmatimonadota bacterium]